MNQHWLFNSRPNFIFSSRWVYMYVHISINLPLQMHRSQTPGTCLDLAVHASLLPILSNQPGHKGALGIRLWIRLVLILRHVDRGAKWTHHRADIRVRHSVELLKLELIVGADVDVGTPVLRRVAVSRRREN